MVLRMDEWHYQCSVAILQHRVTISKDVLIKLIIIILIKYGFLKNRMVMILPKTFIILNILIQLIIFK